MPHGRRRMDSVFFASSGHGWELLSLPLIHGVLLAMGSLTGTLTMLLFASLEASAFSATMGFATWLLPGLLLLDRPDEGQASRRRPANIYLPAFNGAPTALDLAVTGILVRSFRAQDPTLLFCSLLFVVSGRVFSPSKKVFPCLVFRTVMIT